MARYSRGQVCGVDNCPSRLWKRVNGQNVCQYGHVNEFDIEIDDEDDMGNTGAAGIPGIGDFSRRLTNVAGLTSSQITRDKVDQLSSKKIQTRKYGEDFKKLQAKCFQIILAKNSKFIIEKLNLNKEQGKLYFSIVKLLWIKTLDRHLHKKSTKSTNYSIRFLVLINYLAIIQMNLPLYLSDFISLTFDKKFNIERCEYALPRDLRIQIPFSQLKSFHSHSTFNYISILIKDQFCREIIESNILESKLNYYPLLTRITLNLYLSMDIVRLVKNYIIINKIDFSFKECINKYHVHPELKLISIFIICTKIYFMNNSRKQYYQWHQKYLLNDSKFNSVDLKKRILFKSSFKDLYNWNNQQVDEFCDFYNKNILPNVSSANIASNNEIKDKNQLQIVKSIQELFDMDAFEENSASSSPTSAEQLFDDYTAFLFGAYQDKPPPVSAQAARDFAHQPYLVETLFQHFTALYNCTDLQLREALRRVWLSLRASTVK